MIRTPDRGQPHRFPVGSGDRSTLIAGLPVTQRQLWVAGISTSIMKGGNGPPLVLLHGGVASGGLVWGPVLSRLARTHRLLIPDIPGFGASIPVARLDAAFNTWFGRLLDLTCQGRPTVVAHSSSGALVASFAIRYGDRLSRLVLYGSPALGQPGHRRRDRPIGAKLPRLRWADDRSSQQELHWRAGLEAYTRSCAGAPQVRRTMRQLSGSTTRQRTADQLESITVPTSLLWGADDREVPLDLARAASVRYGWPLSVINRAGHAAHLEQPGAFADCLMPTPRTELVQTAPTRVPAVPLLQT